MTDNIFEKATRMKLRFASEKGELSIEQLWDLPLTSSKSAFSLDGIAVATNNELKTISDVSFVAEKSNPRKAILQLQLDVLKHIIGVKITEADAAKKAAARATEKARLLDILASKEDAELESMPKEAILARLAEIDGDN